MASALGAAGTWVCKVAIGFGADCRRKFRHADRAGRELPRADYGLAGTGAPGAGAAGAGDTSGAAHLPVHTVFEITLGLPRFGSETVGSRTLNTSTKDPSAAFSCVMLCSCFNFGGAPD